jgi:hypothetical protein
MRPKGRPGVFQNEELLNKREKPLLARDFYGRRPLMQSVGMLNRPVIGA